MIAFHLKLTPFTNAGYHFVFQVPSTDKNYLNGMWGKLAAEILMQNWDSALEDFNRLKEFIDSNVS